MQRIGKTFSRDVEFTGSCDFVFVYRPPAETPTVLPPLTIGEDREFDLKLNKEQAAAVKKVTGTRLSKVRITMTASTESTELVFTERQKQEMQEALGIEIATMKVSRVPVEAELRK